LKGESLNRGKRRGTGQRLKKTRRGPPRDLHGKKKKKKTVKVKGGGRTVNDKSSVLERLTKMMRLLVKEKNYLQPIPMKRGALTGRGENEMPGTFTNR